MTDPPPGSEDPPFSEDTAHAFSLDQRDSRFGYKANPRDRIMTPLSLALMVIIAFSVASLFQ